MSCSQLSFGGVAVTLAAGVCGATAASFTTFAYVQDWRTVVGQTIERRTADYYTGAGQSVDPEVWSDVGVHLVSSGPLTTAVFGSGAMAIKSGLGQSFEVRWDQPITSLWYKASTPTGGMSFFSGSTFLGGIADGELGVISTVSFDRVVISFPQSDWYGYLHRIEWGVVPGPGALGLLALGLPSLASRRRGHRR